MRTTLALLTELQDPPELWELGGSEAPSEAIGAVLRCCYQRIAPTPAQLAIWTRLCRHERRGIAAFARRLVGLSPAAERLRTFVFCIGRRGLKTSVLLAWSLAFELLCVPHENHAQAGSEVHFTVIAPSIRQAAIATRAVRATLDQLAHLGVAYAVRESGERTELVLERPATRVTKVVAIGTARPELLRGHAHAFLAFDEAGHLQSSAESVASDRELFAASKPGQITFPDAKTLFCGTPGPTGSLFESLVNKPPAGVAVIRAASWETNPRITEAACRAEAEQLAVGDPQRYFDQEFRAARFGLANENALADDTMIEACVEIVKDRLRVGRSCHAIIGFDLALTGRDATAICVCSAEWIYDHQGGSPVRRVVVESIEEHRGKPGAPLELPRVLDRVAEASHAYATSSGLPARVLFDSHYAPEVVRGLRERGVTGVQVPMNPQAQLRRWQILGTLIRGRRLNLPDHTELRRQLSTLRATQLSSGAVRVEGKRDDLVDAMALAVEAAMEIEPSESGEVVIEEARNLYATLHLGNPSDGRRFYRRMPNGTVQQTLPPQGSAEWLTLVEKLEGEGSVVDAVERWKAAFPRWREQLQARRSDGANPALQAHLQNSGNYAEYFRRRGLPRRS